MSTPRIFQDARLQTYAMQRPRPPQHRERIGLTLGDKVVQGGPIEAPRMAIPGHPTWPESARVSVDGKGFSVNMRSPGSLAFAVQSVPIKYLSAAQYIGGTIPTAEVPPYNPIQTYGMQVANSSQFDQTRIAHHGSLEMRFGARRLKYLQESAPTLSHGVVPVIIKGEMREVPYGQYAIREDDLGIAATTPILGQYVPTFGWPDDWGWYWEYLDARLFVPEASFAAKLKTRMVWKDAISAGSLRDDCIDAPDSRRTKILRNIRKMRLVPRLVYGTHNAMVWGNSYQEIVGNSRAVWGAGSSEMDYALSASGIIYGLPRPLLQYTPTTRMYGLKSLDPRAVRIEIHPQEFDLANGEVYRSKYIQRRWAGPLAPTVAYPQSQQVELDFHPDQIFCLQFNRLPDGIYGYSLFRETLYALKGYLLMLQFLPTIFQKRADPLLHFKFGGDVKLPTGVEVTEVPSDDDIEMEKERFVSRQPGEDIYTKVTAEVVEVFKGARNSADLIDFLKQYERRVFLGMGVPLSIALEQTGQEVKWGTMKYEVAEDETRMEYQMPIEDEFNRKLMPLLGGTDEDTFSFPEISEEDVRADAVWLTQMWQQDVISREFIVDYLKLPRQALKGTFFSGVKQEVQQDQMKLQAQLRPAPAPGASADGKTGAGPSSTRAGNLPPGNEKYRVRDTSDGYIIETLGGPIAMPQSIRESLSMRREAPRKRLFTRTRQGQWLAESVDEE